jgi:hypothetical protein
MRSTISIFIAIGLLTLAVCSEARSDDIEGDRWHVALSFGYGIVVPFQSDQSGWDLTTQREHGFAEPAATFSARITRVSEYETRFRGCVDVTFYYFSIPLSTYFSDMANPLTVKSDHLGYIRGRWFVVTPGWQRLDRGSGGFSIFLGVAGVGFGVNQFTTNPYLEGDADQQAAQTDMEASVIVALVPAKFEWFPVENISVGASFSGIFLAKPGINSQSATETWKGADDKLNLSNLQFHMMLGYWF